jgi:hypothetical protein
MFLELYAIYGFFVEVYFSLEVNYVEQNTIFSYMPDFEKYVSNIYYPVYFRVV